MRKKLATAREKHRETNISQQPQEAVRPKKEIIRPQKKIISPHIKIFRLRSKNRFYQNQRFQNGSEDRNMSTWQRLTRRIHHHHHHPPTKTQIQGFRAEPDLPVPVNQLALHPERRNPRFREPGRQLFQTPYHLRPLLSRDS